jgi:MtN3 and saliva related transmembrane protein
VRLWRTRNAEGISLLTFAALATGVALWLVYGIMLHALPIIIANAITLVLVLAVVVLTMRYRRQPPAGK